MTGLSLPNLVVKDSLDKESGTETPATRSASSRHQPGENRDSNATMWGPQDSVQLVYNSNNYIGL